MARFLQLSEFLCVVASSRELTAVLRFKRWLAKVGHERIQEIENPELAQEWMKQLYELKGYPKEWIDKRSPRSHAARENEYLKGEKPVPHIHPISYLKTTEEEKDAEVEAMWVAEIEERYRPIKDGTVTCIPAADAMRQARERIRR